MSAAILIPLCLGMFVLALKRSDLAIAVLIFLQCSVRISALVVDLGGFGTFSPSDFILMGLVMNLLLHRQRFSSGFTVSVKLILVWLVICGLCFSFDKDIDAKVAFNFIVRYASVWIIPLFVLDYSEEQKKKVIASLYFTALFVVAFQIYAYATFNFDFIKEYYYEFAPTGVHEKLAGADEFLQYNVNNGLLPRLYPSGTALCLSMLVYQLANVLFVRHRQRAFTLFTHVTFWLLIFFLLSLRGRAPVFSLIFMLCYAFYVVLFRSSYKTNAHSVKILFSGIIITCALCAAYYFVGDSFHIPFLDQLIERIKGFEAGYYLDDSRSARATDNYASLRIIYDYPVFGIGSPSIPMSMIGFGYDVNPLLSLALLGGVPFFILGAAFSLQAMKHFFRGRSDAFFQRAFPYGIPVVYLLSLAVINSVSVFSNAMHLIPILIFSSLYLSELRKLQIEGAV